MAKIQRYNGNLKAFGADAVGPERSIFGDVAGAQSDDLTDNINAALLRGWGSLTLGEKPYREWFNSAHWVATQLSAYLHQMGVAEWNAAQEYHDGSTVIFDGFLWTSNTDDNVGQTPSLDSDDWSAAGISLKKGVKFVSSTLKLKTGSTLAGVNRATSQLSNGVEGGYTLSLGDIDDTSADGPADFCTVRDVGFINSANASGAILIPSEIDQQPAWSHPSRFFVIENVDIANYQGGFGINLNANQGHITNAKIFNTNIGLNIGAAVNGVSIKDLNITQCLTRSITTKNVDDGTQAKSVTFINTVVQNHQGESDGEAAMLLRSGIAFTFVGLYLENNHTQGATIDASVEGQGFLIKGLFWTPTVGAGATCFRVSGDNFSIDGAEILADGKYLVEFVGSPKNAEIKNIYMNSFTDVQAIIHDSTSEGLNWSSNNGPNLLLNTSFQSVQDGTEFISPVDNTYVLDVWKFRSIAGGGVAPTMNVRRSTVTPNGKYPFSMELDVTDAGTPDAARRVNVSQSFSTEHIQGQRVSLAVMIAADQDLSFNQAQVQIYDGATFRTRQISNLSTEWQTFWIPLDVDAAATSGFVALALDTGGGDVPVGKVRMCAVTMATGGDQPCYVVPSEQQEIERVQQYYEVINLDNRDSLATGSMDTATQGRAVFNYAPKVSDPTLSVIGSLEVRERGGWRAVSSPSFSVAARDRAVVILDGITGAAQGSAVTVHGANTSGNAITIDARL